MVRRVRGSPTTNEGGKAEGNRVAIAPGGETMMTAGLYASLLLTGFALGLNVASILIRSKQP